MANVNPIVKLEHNSSDQPAAMSVPVFSMPPAPANAPEGIAEVRVPDVGDFKDVPIIDIMVKPGDSVCVQLKAGVFSRR
jgi:pyruvate dehydrogenase E2 component (dihydrolipoamide acetyltransferase)